MLKESPQICWNRCMVFAFPAAHSSLQNALPWTGVAVHTSGIERVGICSTIYYKEERGVLINLDG